MNQQQATLIATAVHELAAAIEARPDIAVPELIGAAFWRARYESVACEREQLLETLATTTIERDALRERALQQEQQLARDEAAWLHLRKLACADSLEELREAQQWAVTLLVRWGLAPKKEEQSVA